jgi:hypothetical protein
VFPKLFELSHTKPKLDISRHTNQFFYILFEKKNIGSLEKKNFDILNKKIKTVFPKVGVVKTTVVNTGWFLPVFTT